MRNVSDVIQNLGGPNAIASDLNLPTTTVASWRDRNSIPPVYWPQVVAAAEAKKIKITLEALAAMAVARATERRAPTPTEAA